MSQPGTQVELSQELIDLMRPMVTAVPDYEAGTGEDILKRLLVAKTIDELESVFKGRDLPLDRPWIIQGIAKAESDFKGGIGFYLVMNCVDPTNGEQKVFNTGSGNIMGQLLALFAQEAFPVRAVAIQADKPSKNGFYPQRLTEITLERTAAAPADTIKASK